MLNERIFLNCEFWKCLRMNAILQTIKKCLKLFGKYIFSIRISFGFVMSCMKCWFHVDRYSYEISSFSSAFVHGSFTELNSIGNKWTNEKFSVHLFYHSIAWLLLLLFCWDNNKYLHDIIMFKLVCSEPVRFIAMERQLSFYNLFHKIFNKIIGRSGKTPSN